MKTKTLQARLARLMPAGVPRLIPFNPMTKTKKITIKQARRVLEVVDAGLCNGVGRPVPGQMCVEAAVCFALGEPHGDAPSCVSPILRHFKIALNDLAWSSNAARAKGLRRIAIAQLGSLGIDEKAFAKALAEQTIRMVVPAALRAIAGMRGTDAKHRTALEASAERCEKEGSDAARAAASDAARAAARAASYASDAASYASYAASDASYASYAASDAMLTVAAEAAVQALRMIGAAGIKLLDSIFEQHNENPRL